MHSSTTLPKIHQLANGLIVTLSDRSKPMAGDRWLVRLELSATMPIPAAYWPANQNRDLLCRIQETMRDKLTYDKLLGKHFVAADDMPLILTGFIQQAETNIIPYLANPAFPQRLFAERYKEAEASCRLNRPAPATVVEDDDGPADFSHCFRD